MRARLAALVAALTAALALSCTSASSVATCTALAIPNPLTVNYTAPAGTYCPGPTSVVKASGVTADLTAADITGSGTGYLFKTFDGDSFTVKTGNVSNMAGIILGVLGTGQRSTVTLDGGNWTGVVSGFLYKVNDGGRADVTMRNVTATGLGAGVRTYGSVTATDNHLTGGGNPSSGEPVGFRALDLNDTGVPVPDQTLTLTGNTITGFTGGNSDGAGGEESVSLARVEGNTFDTAGDALLDLKVATAFVIGNVFRGPAGIFGRQLAVHSGVTYSGGNAFTTPDGVSAIQATGAVYSDLDTFNLTGTALAAKAEVACTGSTGFTGPRAGNVTVRRAIGPTPLPVRAVVGSCAGVTYTPVVIVN